MRGIRTSPYGRKGTGSRLCRHLVRDERGAALIEFAIVAVPFIALLIAIVQTSLIMFTQQVLETSAEKSARLILTGNAQKEGLSQASFKDKICATLPSYMKCSDLFVDVSVINRFPDADLSRKSVKFDPKTGDIQDDTKYEPGLPGDIVVLRLMYQSSVVSGPLGFDPADMKGGRRLLLATSVFKNETF